MALFFVFLNQSLVFANAELCNAVKTGNKDAVIKFLENTENLKVMCDNFGKSPLIHWAAIHGHFHIVEVLLKKGVDPNLKVGDKTPLLALLSPANRIHPASQIGVTIMLLAYGADPTAKSMTGPTVEYLARITGNRRLYDIIKTAIKDPEGTRKKLLASFDEYDAKHKK